MTARTGASQKHPGQKHPGKKPIDLESDDPSENDRLHAATTIQSAVEPGDYPADKRGMQVAAGTDGAASGKPEAGRTSE